MTQRVTDEHLIRWTRSNDSALNDVSADCQDARAEIASLRARLETVWTEESLANAIKSRQVILCNVDGGTNIGTMTLADAAMLARVALSRPLAGQVVVDYEAARAELEIQWGTAFVMDGIVDAAKLDIRAIVDAAIGEGKP